jgi:hypothetical protein
MNEIKGFTGFIIYVPPNQMFSFAVCNQLCFVLLPYLIEGTIAFVVFFFNKLALRFHSAFALPEPLDLYNEPSPFQLILDFGRVLDSLPSKVSHVATKV